jgi:hypothetical protein
LSFSCYVKGIKNNFNIKGLVLDREFICVILGKAYKDRDKNEDDFAIGTAAVGGRPALPGEFPHMVQNFNSLYILTTHKILIKHTEIQLTLYP